MLAATPKKALLFVSAGLGDTLLLLPLVRLLSNRGFEVSALVTTKVPVAGLLKESGLFAEVITLQGKAKMLHFALGHLRFYQLAIVNYFAASRTNLILAKQLATMVHTNRIPDQLSCRVREALVYIPPTHGIHDAEQNLLLAGQGQISLCKEDIALRISSKTVSGLPKHYIALQISAGNNIQTYKNWPISGWINFLKRCKKTYPLLTFVMLGDKTETMLAAEILAAGTGNVVSFVGQTTIDKAAQVISGCSMFLGLDGGLMHLAAFFQKPSFSLWGPTSRKLYGYEQFDPRLNRCLSLELSCAPCSAWIDANTSRYTNPELCPDHRCMKTLSPERVFEEFSTFAKTHALI
jgi:ADP-heptose:LPS heptosyltransferase